MKEKRQIRMIALDLDGTVFNHAKQITERTKKAIERAIQKGVAVLPATGRPEAGLPEEFMKIPGVRYALTSNGGRIIDQKEGTTVYEEKISWETVQEVIRCVKDCPGSVWEVYCGGKCLAEKEGYRYIEHPAMPPSLKEYIRHSRILVPGLAEKLSREKTGAEKMHMLFEKTEERDKMLEELRKNPGIQVSIAAPFNLEINSVKAGKGNGLLELGKILGIRKEEIMACGDSWNDWSMLRCAGFPVVMENGDEETKKLAAFVTKSNEEDGVAYAIEKFVL